MLSLNIPPQILSGEECSEGSSYGQEVTGSFITAMRPLMHHIWCRAFWWDIKSPRWLSPLQLRLGALRLLAFPKTKITFEMEEISDYQWDSRKCDRAADGNWENLWGLKVPTLKGTETSLSYVECSLYLVSSSINVSIFHIMWLDTFWTDLENSALLCVGSIVRDRLQSPCFASQWQNVCQQLAFHNLIFNKNSIEK